MKFVRFLCNLGIFIISYFMIFAVGVLSYSAVSWGISSDEAIHFVSSDKEKVNFWDGWGFQVADIGVNVSSEPKPYVRNIFGGHGKWADYAVNFVVGVFKPIILPHAQIDNLAEHRTASIYEDLTDDYSAGTTNKLDNLHNKYVTKLDTYGAFVELASFKVSDAENELNIRARYLGVEEIKLGTEEDPSLLMVITSKGGTVIEARFIVNEDQTVDTSKIQIFIDGEILKNSDGDKYDFFSEKKVGGYEAVKSAMLFDGTYQYWAIDANDSLANRMWLSYKYNDSRFDIYARKFLKTNAEGNILVDGNGKPVIKTEVVFLCVIQWVAIIVAAIFTIRYPVTIIQARITERKNRKKNTDVGVTL